MLEPNATYVHNWHIDAICAHLEAVTDGRLNRLLINVPPGSMKSLLVSVFWPAWEWGPRGLRSLRYLTTSFNEIPVKRDTRKTRDLILSDWYRSLWPEVLDDEGRLSRAGELSFANRHTGTREGVPFGSLTGQRGDRLILDDPHSVELAESETERANTTRKFREGAVNRLNDQERSAIVVIMQRLHEDDIAGTILKLGMGYTHVCLPMEFEADRRCETEIGFKDPRATDGDLLDPVRMPRETVDKLKRDTTEYAYAGQYQQRPAPREGGIFKRHWFEIVGAAPAGARKCRGWDLAATKSATAAYTAGVRLSVHNGTYYVEDVIRERGSAADVERLILGTAKADGLNVKVSIPQDPGQSGKAQVAAFAKLLAGFNCRFSPESGDKESRALPVSAQAEVGNIKIVKGKWNDAFLEEITSFPAGTYKDQTDALSRAFAELLPAEPRLVVQSAWG